MSKDARVWVEGRGGCPPCPSCKGRRRRACGGEIGRYAWLKQDRMESEDGEGQEREMRGVKVTSFLTVVRSKAKAFVGLSKLALFARHMVTSCSLVWAVVNGNAFLASLQAHLPTVSHLQTNFVGHVDARACNLLRRHCSGYFAKKEYRADPQESSSSPVTQSTDISLTAAVAHFLLQPHHFPLYAARADHY